MQVPELAHRGIDEDQTPWVHHGNPLFWFGQVEYCLQGRENHSVLWWHSCSCAVTNTSYYWGPEKDHLSVFMSLLGWYIVWSHCYFPTTLDLKYGHLSVPWSVYPERAVFVYWFPQFLLAGAVLYFLSSIHWYDRPPSLQYGCRTHCILTYLTNPEDGGTMLLRSFGICWTVDALSTLKLQDHWTVTAVGTW